MEETNRVLVGKGKPKGSQAFCAVRFPKQKTHTHKSPPRVAFGWVTFKQEKWGDLDDSQ